MTQTPDTDRDYRITVAKTIQDQIPRWLRMAVGYRLPTTTDKGLKFQVRGRSTYIVTVDYDRGSDLYDVAVATKGARSRVFHTAEQVDAETMVAVIDSIDRGHLHP